MGRAAYLRNRLLQLVPVLIGLTLVCFALIHLIPGDPALTILGIHATPAAIAELHREWGLNRSLPDQYWLFLERVVHGNLGQSLIYQQSATSLIASRIPATLWLIVYSVVLAVVITVPLAVLAASKQNGVRDQVVRFVPLIGLGMPAFWIGIFLILFLGLDVRLFPVGGYGTGVLGHLRSMFLPSLTIALGMSPTLIRSLRTSMLTVLQAEYVTTARSKGLTRMRLMGRHVLRNALIPTVTVLGINIGYLVGGTLVVEYVFGLPGIGQLMINSISQRDFPVVQGVTLVFGVLVVAVNLLTDLVYASLDPRVRLGQ